MSEKFRGKYRIASARMKNYDYASNGAYFLTIVTKNREHFFGEIVETVDGRDTINRVSTDDHTDIPTMQLSEIGQIAQKYWQEIPRHFPFIRLDEMVVMPNHIHGILWIDKSLVDGVDDAVGCRDAINRASTGGGITKKNNPMFHNNISRVLRWYKGRCSFEIRKISPNFAWQSRFHDRIIRDEDEMNRIRNYIIKNPQMWERDRNNQGIWS